MKSTHTGMSSWQKFKKQIDLHMMVFPVLIGFIVFSYFPMYGIIIAFKNYNVVQGIFASSWARNFGMEHFIDFFNAPGFYRILWNTILIALLKLAILSFPPMVLAIVINEVRHDKFKKVTQTISYLPHFVSWVVIGGMIYSFFSYNGAVNIFLKSIGLIDQSVNYIGSASFFRPMLILSDLWKEVGWGSILYIGVISSIDQSLYEAIEIDGGGRWAKIYYVTWPSLKGVFMILFILNCGSIMSGMGSTFNQCYVLGNDMIKDVSEILDTYVLKTGMESGRYSYATAIGLFKSVINLAMLVFSNKLSRRISGKSLF